MKERPSRNGSQGREEGFALLETVIAFVILAISLGVGVQTITQNARSFLRTSDIEAAGLILDGLAATRLRTLREAGVFTGESGDGNWEIASEAVRDNHIRPLLAVTVTIWPRGENGPRFTYHSLASGAPQQ